MIDLSAVTHEEFEPGLNRVFTIKTEDGNGPRLELIEIKPLGKNDPEAKSRQAFSLLFRGPMDPVLHQQLHHLENEKLGEILIFLVPIGCDDTGMLYDATFN